MFSEPPVDILLEKNTHESPKTIDSLNFNPYTVNTYVYFYIFTLDIITRTDAPVR